jgi:hypothetical protein
MARSQIASEALVRTRLLCMVAKQATPAPARNRKPKASRYHRESENSRTAAIKRMDPATKSGPFRLTSPSEATISEPISAPRPSAASKSPVSSGPSPNTCRPTTGTMC